MHQNEAFTDWRKFNRKGIPEIKTTEAGYLILLLH
jgi:hypothetical protein